MAFGQVELLRTAYLLVEVAVRIEVDFAQTACVAVAGVMTGIEVVGEEMQAP